MRCAPVLIPLLALLLVSPAQAASQTVAIGYATAQDSFEPSCPSGVLAVSGERVSSALRGRTDWSFQFTSVSSSSTCTKVGAPNGWAGPWDPDVGGCLVNTYDGNSLLCLTDPSSMDAVRSYTFTWQCRTCAIPFEWHGVATLAVA